MGVVDSINRVVRSTGGPPADGQTPQFFVASVSLNAVALAKDLLTVPAGVTFYVTDIICTSNTSTAFDVTLNVRTGAGGAKSAIFQGHVFSTAPLDCCGIDTQPQATAGQTLSINAPVTAATTVDYNIYGYTQ